MSNDTNERRLTATMAARDRIIAALREHGDPRRKADVEALAKRQNDVRKQLGARS